MLLTACHCAAVLIVMYSDHLVFLYNDASTTYSVDFVISTSIGNGGIIAEK